MKRICTSETSFLYRIFMFFGVITAGLFLTYLVFISVVCVQCGFDMTLFQEHLNGFTSSVSLLRLMQILQSFFVFIIPPFILIKLYRENSRDFLCLQKPEWSSALVGAISIIVMIPLTNALVQWNAGMHLPQYLQGLESWMRTSEDAAEKVTNLMMKGTTWYDLVINLIVVGVLAGLGEELLFRGLLQNLVAREMRPHAESKRTPDWVMHTSIWLVAFLFSAIHLQFYGFFPRLLLGAWFGYLLWWSGSIWVPILAHFTNNTLATLISYSENKGLIKNSPDQIGLNETWWLCLISFLLLIGCVFYLKKGIRKRDLPT